MENFFEKQFKDMGVQKMAQIMLAIGVIGVTVVSILIFLVIKDYKVKTEELKKNLENRQVNKTEETLKLLNDEFGKLGQ